MGCDCQDREPHESEIARNAAEARKHEAEALLKETEAAAAQIALKAAQRKERDELAADKHHHVYNYDQVVSEGSVKACIQALTTWARQDPGCEIELRLNSPGGSIIDGFALIDFLTALRKDGHKITTVAYGMAASMAGVILQAGDERVMGENAVLLIHEGSLGAIGDYGEVKDRVELMEMLHERILALFTERSKMSKAAIKRKWSRKDWWLLSDDALKLGFVDSVR